MPRFLFHKGAPDMKRNSRRGSLGKYKAIGGWIFVAPALFYFALFSFYPLINAFYTSTLQKDILSLQPSKFIGLENYVYLFRSEDFWKSIEATAVFTLGCFIPLATVSLLLAVFIYSRSKRFQNFLQMAYFLPAILSTAAAAVVWLLVFDPRGLANQWVNFIANTPGIDHKWLALSHMVRFSTIIIYFWKYIGYFTIIYFAGLSNIPRTYYEAAKVDGAGSWTQFWSITLPLVKPTIVLVSIIAMIQCMRTFSTQYLFTQSGAATEPINVITLNIYRTAMRDRYIGRASAMSIILFFAILIFSWFQLKVSRTEKISYI